MESPKCPYCGDEQYLTIEDHSELGRMVCYLCIHCGSRSPAKTTIEEAFAAAMKRDRAKGEWGKPIWGRDHLDRPIIIGSECSICHKISDFQTHYCPNCGADMRKEANDERES